MTRNWKTTVASAATVFFGFVLYAPQDFAWAPWLVHLAGFGCAGGMLAFGVAAKDRDVHSTAAQVHEATREAAEKK